MRTIYHGNHLFRILAIPGILCAMLLLAAYTGAHEETRSAASAPKVNFIGVALSADDAGSLSCRYTIAGDTTDSFRMAKGGVLLVRPFKTNVPQWRTNVYLQKNTSGEDPVEGDMSQRNGVRPEEMAVFKMKMSLKKESHRIKIDCVTEEGTAIQASYSPGLKVSSGDAGFEIEGQPPATEAAAATGGPTMVIDD